LEKEHIESLKDIIRIKIAKTGEYLLAKKKGNIQMTSVVDGEEYKINMRHILIVPDLEVNLLSVRKLEMSGYKIIFEK
jgi:hypothetical protein